LSRCLKQGLFKDIGFETILKIPTYSIYRPALLIIGYARQKKCLHAPYIVRYNVQKTDKMRHNMQRLKIDQDIKPLSEVRTGIATFIKQVHDTKRPVIITQHGKGVAVLLDAHEFEAMQEKIELLTDIQMSLNQLEKGAGISHKDAKEKVLKRVFK
jgi:prevent-host-death family protein